MIGKLYLLPKGTPLKGWNTYGCHRYEVRGAYSHSFLYRGELGHMVGTHFIFDEHLESPLKHLLQPLTLQDLM